MIEVDSRGVRRAVFNRDAMVYPAIRDLIDGGYIDCWQETVEGEPRHVCGLTEKGKEAYVGTAEAWERIRASTPENAGY